MSFFFQTISVVRVYERLVVVLIGLVTSLANAWQGKSSRGARKAYLCVTIQDKDER